MITVRDIEKLQKECEQLKIDIALSRGRIEQLKQGEEGKTIESLKEELVQLESERVELEQKFSQKSSAYHKAYHDRYS